MVLHEAFEIGTNKIGTTDGKPLDIDRLQRQTDLPVASTISRMFLLGLRGFILTVQLSTRGTQIVLNFVIEQPVRHDRRMRHQVVPKQSAGIAQPGRMLFR